MKWQEMKPGERFSTGVLWAGRFALILDPQLVGDATPYHIAMKQTLSWCSEQFGDSHTGRWYLNGSNIYFRYENDAFSFKIRWC